MFDDVLLPPCLRDDVIAVGSFTYGLFCNRYNASYSASSASVILSEADHEYKDRNGLDNDNTNDE